MRSIGRILKEPDYDLIQGYSEDVNNHKYEKNGFVIHLNVHSDTVSLPRVLVGKRSETRPSHC
jgi:hypothetical protein